MIDRSPLFIAPLTTWSVLAPKSSNLRTDYKVAMDLSSRLRQFPESRQCQELLSQRSSYSDRKVARERNL